MEFFRASAAPVNRTNLLSLVVAMLFVLFMLFVLVLHFCFICASEPKEAELSAADLCNQLPK